MAIWSPGHPFPGSLEKALATSTLGVGMVIFALRNPVSGRSVNKSQMVS
jgi:hypothetical protein